MTASVDPLALTFSILESHDSQEAGETLLEAVTGSWLPAAKLAAAALVNRRSQLAILEMVRRNDRLHDEVCTFFARNPQRFIPALKQCLSGSDVGDRAAGLKFIQRTCNTTQIPAMIGLLDNSDELTQRLAATSLVELSDLLSRRLLTQNSELLPGLDADAARTLRTDILNRLNGRLSDFAQVTHAESLVEVILILGRIEDEAVVNVLDKRGDACKAVATRILGTSVRPGVMELVCQAMTRQYPSPVFFDVLQQRDDPAFAEHLLNWLPSPRSRLLVNNLGRIKSLPWLLPEHPVLTGLPTALHPKLMALMQVVKGPPEALQEIRAWLVRSSDASGRKAAEEILNTLGTDQVQHILYEALDSDSVEIQAWATHQLRQQKMPDAFQQLLSRLDAVDEVVREAAREELSDFNLARLLELFPQLPASTSRRCGEIVTRLDTQVTSQLRTELAHPWRWKRVRATRAADSLGLAESVLNDIIKLSEDVDTLVRRTAVEVLAKYPNPSSAAALKRCVSDDSRIVREAARQAMETLRSTLNSASSRTT